jgi:hypothetical protein
MPGIEQNFPYVIHCTRTLVENSAQNFFSSGFEFQIAEFLAQNFKLFIIALFKK